MTDIFSIKKRSEIMSRIHSKGNRSTEVKVIAIFRAAGIKGWRRNSRLVGNPDFVFLRSRIAIFVDGCFWHGCTKCCHWPTSNTAYWKAKISGNQSRDKLVVRALQKGGWMAIRLWEHDLKDASRIAKRIKRALDRRAVLHPNHPCLKTDKNLSRRR